VIVLFYSDRGLMAYKWGLLLHRFNIRVPLFTLTQIYLAAFTIGALLPTAIGGDLFRLYSLSRYKINVEAVIASIFYRTVHRSVGGSGLSLHKLRTALLFTDPCVAI
jgi:uncharacterized membrane protein YbhN (UPF0104 family)